MFIILSYYLSQYFPVVFLCLSSTWIDFFSFLFHSIVFIFLPLIFISIIHLSCALNFAKCFEREEGEEMKKAEGNTNIHLENAGHKRCSITKDLLNKSIRISNMHRKHTLCWALSTCISYNSATLQGRCCYYSHFTDKENEA